MYWLIYTGTLFLSGTAGYFLIEKVMALVSAYPNFRGVDQFMVGLYIAWFVASVVVTAQALIKTLPSDEE